MRTALPASSIALAAALAACGGSSDDPRVPTVGENPLCDPVAQTGCEAGWKCTWIDAGGGAGSPGCAPEGAVAAGGSCTFGDPGPTTGYDDCAAGLVCVGGTCLPTCHATSGAGCTAAEVCTRYAGLFEADVGACTPGCNPLTQTRLTDGAAACGSPDPSAPTRGCYGAPSSTASPSTFTCAPVVDPTKTHLDPADRDGTVYLNGCAPGHLPLLRESSASSQVVCIALCAPAESYQGSSALRQGLSPFSCPQVGATAITEECRFWWFLEGAETAASALTNGLGFCFDPTRYDDPSSAGSTLPSCADLPNVDTDADGVPQHLEHGCGPRPGP